MKFTDLATYLHQHRVRLFGDAPDTQPISQVLAEIGLSYSQNLQHLSQDEYEKLQDEVKATISYFSRNETLPLNTIEEKYALRARFDFAIGICQLLTCMQTEDGLRLINEPSQSIQDEDLVEWALLQTLNYDRMMRNYWTLAKSNR